MADLMPEPLNESETQRWRDEIDRLHSALAEKTRLLELAKDEWELQDAKRTELEVALAEQRQQARHDYQRIHELVQEVAKVETERDEARRERDEHAKDIAGWLVIKKQMTEQLAAKALQVGELLMPAVEKKENA